MKGVLHPTENRLWRRSFLPVDHSVEWMYLVSGVWGSGGKHPKTSLSSIRKPINQSKMQGEEKQLRGQTNGYRVVKVLEQCMRILPLTSVYLKRLRAPEKKTEKKKHVEAYRNIPYVRPNKARLIA